MVVFLRAQNRVFKKCRHTRTQDTVYHRKNDCDVPLRHIDGTDPPLSQRPACQRNAAGLSAGGQLRRLYAHRLRRSLLYLTLFVLLTALFCGLFALLSFAVSFYIHNRVALLFTPFLLFLGLQYVENSIASQTSAWSVEAVPMSFLHTTAPLLLADGRVIFGEAAIFLLFSVGTILLRGRYDEIY